MDKTKVTDPKAFRFAAGTLSLAAGEGQRRFEGLAYSGKEVTDHPFWPKVIFDLSSTRSPERIPVLLNHDGDRIVGHTDSVEIGSEIKVGGALYADEPDGALVAKRSDAGFPWQMSVHIAPGRVDEVRAGETVKVNGEKFTGPGYVFRQARIREVSFCPVGADQRTHAVALSGLQEEIDVEITKEQYDAIVAERDALKAEVTALAEKVNAFTAAQAQAAKDARVAAVKQLFADLGREFTDEAAKPYVEMAAEQFAAVEKDLRSAKPAAPAHLFSERATGEPGAPGKSPLLADAERRAAAAKK